MTCHDIVKEAVKIIYTVHNEVKNKAFELKLNTIGELNKQSHQIVSKDEKEKIENYAKESLKEEYESDCSNM